MPAIQVPRPLRDLLPRDRPLPRDMLPNVPAPLRNAQSLRSEELSRITGLPFIDEVWTDHTNIDQTKAGKAFAWPRAGPLALYIENTQDQEVTIEIHGGMNDDTSRKLASPLRSISLGPKQRQLLTMNSAASDPWAPYVWPIAYSAAVPEQGNLRIIFGRPGI